MSDIILTIKKKKSLKGCSNFLLALDAMVPSEVLDILSSEAACRDILVSEWFGLCLGCASLAPISLCSSIGFALTEKHQLRESCSYLETLSSRTSFTLWYICLDRLETATSQLHFTAGLK